MDIFVREAPSTPDKRDKNLGRYDGKGKKKDRRKATRDRRKSVNEGIFVTLSTKEEKRSLRDRRRQNLHNFSADGENVTDQSPKGARKFKLVDSVI